jgi:CDP-glucose 4,6-dehydratase
VNELKLSHIKPGIGPILVTGHTGFKGTWLTMLLEHMGIEVAGLSLAPSSTSLFTRANRLGRIQEEFIDIRNETKVEKFITRIKPRIIIHLAAQSLVIESYRNPKQTFDVNVTGLTNILDIFSRSSSIEVILVSTTDKVYENKEIKKSFTEEDPLRGKDPYSASKVAAENAIFAWRKLVKLNSSQKILTARAGNVIGGGDFSENRLVPDLVRAFSKNSDLIIRNPLSTRPWQHVLDPLTGYLDMIGQALNGNDLEVLNFGPDGNSMTVRQVVDIASKIWHSNCKIIFETNQNDLESETLNLNSARAKKELGWVPFWTQEEAVKDSISWWKDVLVGFADVQSRCQQDINRILHLKTIN